jgi:hypothetical protein
MVCFCNLDNRPVKWKNKFHEKERYKKADALLSVVNSLRIKQMKF